MELLKTNSLPETKQEIQLYAQQLAARILEGDKDPLLIFKEIKIMKELIKEVESKQNVKDYVFEEAEKHGKNFDLHNCNFLIKEAGVKYDYSKCNDDELILLHSQAEELKEAIKERENFLKNLPKESEVFNSEGVQVLRPTKKSTTSLTIKIK